VKAIVAGAFAEHSADVHELVDELVAEGAHRAAQKYLLPTHRAKGATKALLCAAFGAPAWRALSVSLHRSARAHARERRYPMSEHAGA
jgi:hypothetical protein